jgi:hypothetical protein
MTIQRSYGEVEFHCDGTGCHEVFETETRDWETALELYRASDWTTRRVGEDFLHICPDCLQAEAPIL